MMNAGAETKQNLSTPPPPGYPTENSTQQQQQKPKRKGLFHIKNKGEKGFIEGCLAALCCCFVCEECCC